MKKTKLHFVMFAFAGIIVYVSCRKIDRQASGPSVNDIESRFFNQHLSGNPLVTAAVVFLKGKNDKQHFVEKTVKEIGYPYWDKSLVLANMKVTATRTQTGDSANVVFIPFVQTNELAVNAALRITMTPSDTSFKFICDWQYTDSTNTGLIGRHQSLLLMNLDKSVFGHELFNVTDSLAFDGLGANVKYVQLDSVSSGRMLNGKPLQTGRTSLLEVVYTMTVCYTYYVPVHQGQVTGCPPGPNCPLYTTATSCETISWTEYEYEEGGGGGTGETGGTGGSGGGGPITPPGSPCSGGTSARTATYTPCGPGWIPVSGSDPYNVPGILNFLSWQVTPSDQVAIDFWKNNNIDTIGLDSCMKLLVQKLITGSGDNFIGKILAKMEKSIFENNTIKKFKVKFVTELFDTTICGQVINHSYDTATGIFSTTLRLNTYWLEKGTELFWTSTIIHELIHAYLRNIHYRYYYTLNPTQVTGMSMGQLFNSYIDTLLARNTRHGINIFMSGNLEVDHNYMASYLLNSMADAIERADNSSLSYKRYYWFLTWGGLQQTQAWNYHWSNYPSWPPSNPSPSEDSTRGLKYALTQNRLDSINKANYKEQNGLPGALGKRKIPGGCY